MESNVIIKTNDKKEFHTTWNSLKNITYFTQLLNSGMKESQSNEIKFDLNLKQTKTYLKINSDFDINLSGITADEFIKYVFDINVDYKVKEIYYTLKILSFDDLVAIYNQVEYHQHDRLLTVFNYFIENLSYSIELYYWNLRSKFFTTSFLADRCVSQMSCNKINQKFNWNLSARDKNKSREVIPITFPPTTDEEFWKEAAILCIELEAIDNDGKLAPSKNKSWWRA